MRFYSEVNISLEDRYWSGVYNFIILPVGFQREIFLWSIGRPTGMNFRISAILFRGKYFSGGLVLDWYVLYNYQ